MGKIPVQALAKKMGVPEQDLLFKLKSIGVRVEGEGALVDTEMIQAILQGKKLAQPREVILRDESSDVPVVPKRRTPPRRTPTSQMRPVRRRTVVHKSEPRIKTLPSTDKPARTLQSAAQPSEAVDEAPATATQAAAPPPQAAATPGAAATPTPDRPPAHRPVEPRREPAKKRRQKAPLQSEEDLRAYRGSVKEVETAVEEEADVPASGRRHRRAERKREEVEAEEQGKVLSFKKTDDTGPITISEGMRVRDLSEKIGIKSKDLIKTLFARGVMATVNQVLEPDLAQQLAEDLGFEAMVVTFEEEVQLQQEVQQEKKVEGTVPRAPVVTIMGHVDHGKTSLLDAIRSSRLTEAESGGITQHIAAYNVEVNDRKIVFLDTPGHEAFTQLRARGAKVTDLVVLVVAADDGVMPQTVEAIDHARAAGVPIIVALNKMDKANANPDRVKKDLADHGLMVEDWGGTTVAVPMSALKKEGIDDLLEMIALTSDMLELKADPELPAQGVIIEARKEAGRGVVATVLVQNGTLTIGEIFVSGATWGRVRSMMDDRGQRVDTALPATPVEVSGFNVVPAAGDTFQVVSEESKARNIAEFRRQERRQRDIAPTLGRLSLESLFDQIEQGAVKELPVVLKADVQGSVEVLKATLEKLSTDKVKVLVIRSAVGAVTTDDVLLASASGALIYGFNVRPERNAAELSDKEEVEIRSHTVIYELVDELRLAMAGLLDPIYREVEQGRAEVRETFKVPKVGTVAGCHVVEGVIPRNAEVRLLRDNVVVYEGTIGSLRRFKDDASEVRSGFDCGIGLERFQDVKPGDIIEAFSKETVTPTL